ncbi:MAG: hypothetical protein COX07_06490 [Bacteroidetes bacterium CG23_combo_of_CG06-09_8_20_14_all_32_9]|nr:MAG: hypothetical protein COX07_06490 [Bacteroidetes bacterium CG23_combo_of_CG06-09_8_20_14_all_32_9]
MINFSKYCILFLVLAIPLIISYFYMSRSLLWIVLYFLFFLTGLVFGSINICSCFYIKTMCKGNSDINAISLTFDDGPDQNITPKVLKILKKHNVKACFFCIGKNAETNKELLKQINEEGHIIGNHGYSHSLWFDLFSLKKMKSEILNADNLIFDIINKRTKFFRPPYGVTNPTLAKVIKTTGLISVGWSLRSLDTTAKGNTGKILKRLEKIKAGDIVLFHDNISEIPEILEKFIELVKFKNIKFARLDDLLNCKAYE